MESKEYLMVGDKFEGVGEVTEAQKEKMKELDKRVKAR